MLSIKGKLITAFGVLFLSVVTLPQAAKAAPVTITSGAVSILSNIRDTLSFNFSGSNLSVSGLNLHAPIQQYMTPCVSSASRCQPGDLIFPNARTSLSAEGPSSVTFNGTTVSVSWASHDSILQFSGAGVVIPSSAADQITLTMPFEMIGTINVHDVNNPGPVIFSTMISGSGLATFTLTRPAGNPVGFAITAARYDFSPAAVPEPASLILLTTGIVGFGASRWRGTRRSKEH
jgi:hypothetical protein